MEMTCYTSCIADYMFHILIHLKLHGIAIGYHNLRLKIIHENHQVGSISP
jgi:hypothetical protein